MRSLAEPEVTMTKSTIESVLLDPDTMFAQDVMAEPASQLSEPHRIPIIKAYAKGTFPDRTPDFTTRRTDVYIIGWEVKDPDDPFYKD